MVKTAWNLQYQMDIMTFAWRLSNTTGILANRRLIPRHCIMFYPVPAISTDSEFTLLISIEMR